MALCLPQVVTPQQGVLMNGQQQLMSPPIGSSATANTANVSTANTLQATVGSPNKFIVTNDYIQQSKWGGASTQNLIFFVVLVLVELLKVNGK